jgi:sodium/hydrogen antiporter
MVGHMVDGASSTGGMLDAAVVVIALLVCAIGARALARIWVSTALFLVLFGTLVGPSVMGLFDVAITTSSIHTLAAVALATVLFSDAASTDTRRLRGLAAQPARMLTIGLVGSIVLGALVAAVLMPVLTPALALVVGTILAPTDAALGAPVVTDRRVPGDVREVLTVESGLNDGLAVPILLIALGWAELEDTGDVGLLQLIVRVLGIGALVGAGLAAVVAAWWILTSRRWGGVTAWSALVPLLTAVSGYFLAEQLGGSGFIAAFGGGLLFGAICRDRVEDDLLVDESVSNLLQGVTWFVFGAVAVGPVLLAGDFDVRWLLYALLSLTVVRLVPVGVSLLGTRTRLPTVAFMGWFGPRGLASVVFLIVVLDVAPPAAQASSILGAVTVTVALSVLLHGLSAPAAVAAYGAWASRTEAPQPGHSSVLDRRKRRERKRRKRKPGQAN